MTEHAPAVLWGTVLFLGVLTYGFRASFVVLVGRFGTPPRVDRALRFVPPAILGALVVQSLVSGGAPGSFDERVVAVVLAAVAAWRTESVLATLSTGMVALWVLRFAVP